MSHLTFSLESTIGLGECDLLMDYVEKGYEEHSHWLIYLHIDPSMDGLRDRFRVSKTSCGVSACRI